MHTLGIIWIASFVLLWILLVVRGERFLALPPRTRFLISMGYAVLTITLFITNHLVS